jgi:transposase
VHGGGPGLHRAGPCQQQLPDRLHDASGVLRHRRALTGQDLPRGGLGVDGVVLTASGPGKNNYLIARYRRLATRRGRKRALVAIGHSIPIAVWHILTHNINYRDLGANYFLTRLDPARTARRLLDQLHQLGYQAHLKPITTR